MELYEKLKYSEEIYEDYFQTQIGFDHMKSLKTRTSPV